MYPGLHEYLHYTWDSNFYISPWYRFTYILKKFLLKCATISSWWFLTEWPSINSSLNEINNLSWFGHMWDVLGVVQFIGLLHQQRSLFDFSHRLCGFCQFIPTAMNQWTQFSACKTYFPVSDSSITSKSCRPCEGVKAANIYILESRMVFEVIIECWWRSSHRSSF